MELHRASESYCKASPFLKRLQNYSPAVVMTPKLKELDQTSLNLRLKHRSIGIEDTQACGQGGNDCARGG
jgi:hypothetical protein